MAKTPATKKSTLQGSKTNTTPKPRKPARATGSNGGTKKIPPAVKFSGDGAPDCDCCAAICAAFGEIEIGVAGFLWMDTAGAFHVATHPGGSKKMMWDDNGPYFANP